MLHEAYNTVKKNYYDTTFHGIDLDERYHAYDDRLKTVTNLGAGFHVVAAFLSGFHDSHLFFLPPRRAVRFIPGYRMDTVGDKCFVTQVKPGSDAAKKLHRGDEIVHFNTFAVGRQDLWDIEYGFHVLDPAPTERLDLVSPDDGAETVTIHSSVVPLKRNLNLGLPSDVGDMIREEESDEDLTRERVVETKDVLYWKMAQFSASDTVIGGVFDKAREHPVLVIDLRGNPGGSIDTLQWVVGNLFDHDIKISDRVGRKEKKPQIAKAARSPFKGKVIVLIDARSASSSELLARVVQLEHRGVVLGDISAGAVMEAQRFYIQVGDQSVIRYGFQVTDANLIMKDGKSLEQVGVMPDERILPTAADLAEHRDPVLARASELAGDPMDPTAAAKMFPFEWSQY